MKIFLLSLLFTASTGAFPLLAERQSCPPAISATPAAEVLNAFVSANIIGDVVSTFTPTTDLVVKYNNKNENLGNEFSVLETLQEPTFSFNPEASTNPTTTKYTYMQVDPDGPGPALPLYGIVLHHLVYDVQPSCVSAQSPKTQVPYLSLQPESIAPHRFISLLYRQPPNYTPPPVNIITEVGRVRFDLQKYVDDGGLTLVGGNFLLEGLGNTVCAVVPGCTVDGDGV